MAWLLTMAVVASALVPAATKASADVRTGSRRMKRPMPSLPGDVFGLVALFSLVVLLLLMLPLLRCCNRSWWFFLAPLQL